MALIGLAGSGGLTLGSMAISVGMGLFLIIPGSWLFRQGMTTTKSLSVSMLSYAQPVLTLGWLALFTSIDVHRLDYVLTGGGAVLLAGFLLNVQLVRADINT